MGKYLKTAFVITIPVMLGYLFVGIAFGLLLYHAGYNFLWAGFMSVTIYAGAMQFVVINFLKGGFSLLEIAAMTLFVNIRHIFFGLSFLEKWKDFGAKKLYMIFGLTDETYSLLCALKTPKGMDEKKLSFLISLFNQCYWVLGSIIGALFGAAIPFNTKGIDFAMTAMFIVIFIDQWKSEKNHIPALLGLCSTVLCLVLFPKQSFMLFSMLLMIILLLLFRKKITSDYELESAQRREEE